MNKAFKVGLLVGIFAIATALFQQSGNGRYQYARDGDAGIIVDTRTGEFWNEGGDHFEPRAAQITTHAPFIIDEAPRDRRSNSFRDCLFKGRKDCLAQLRAEEQRDLESAAASEKTGPPGIPQSGVANVSDIKNAADDASNKH
jgi:hypothetical protein